MHVTGDVFFFFFGFTKLRATYQITRVKTTPSQLYRLNEYGIKLCIEWVVLKVFDQNKGKHLILTLRNIFLIDNIYMYVWLLVFKWGWTVFHVWNVLLTWYRYMDLDRLQWNVVWSYYYNWKLMSASLCMIT